MDVFAALADPTRRRIVEQLSHEGPQTQATLAADLPITRQAVAKHLSALDAAGLVAPSRRGREVRYALTPAPLTDAAQWLGEVGGEWDERLARLHRMLSR